MGIFKSLFSNLSKSRDRISNVIKAITLTKLTDELLEELEEVLIESDMGWELTDKIINSIKDDYSKDSNIENIIINVISKHFKDVDVKEINSKIVLVIGVNGVGKTTSLAKVANYYKKNGDKVLLVAADTFRAGAVEQLSIWSEKLDIDLVKNEMTNDPAAIAYDGVISSKKKGYSKVFIDTSGRMHNSTNLKNELSKVYSVIRKQEESVEVLIVIDANLGQNSISQIKEFSDIIPIDGAIVTKLDGTAKGGVILRIIDEFDIPIFFLGTGESENDIVPFSLPEYLNSYFSFEGATSG